jgi:hypothetical protein
LLGEGFELYIHFAFNTICLPKQVILPAFSLHTMPKKPRKPSKPRKLLTPAELVQRRFLKAGIKLTREDIAEQQRLDAMIFERPPFTTHKAETKQHPIMTETPVPVSAPTKISNVATLEPEVKREGGSEDKGSENGVDDGASRERMQGLAESRKKQDTLADLDMAQSGRRRDEDEDQEDVGMVAHQVSLNATNAPSPLPQGRRSRIQRAMRASSQAARKRKVRRGDPTRKAQTAAAGQEGPPGWSEGSEEEENGWRRFG